MKPLTIIKIFTLTPLLLVVSSVAARSDCPPRHVTVHISDGGEAQPAVLRVTPAIIRVGKGCSFEVRVPPNKTVKTVGQNKSWLNGQGNSANFSINVPATEASGDYKYTVEVVGFGILDPRARVN